MNAIEYQLEKQKQLLAKKGTEELADKTYNIQRGCSFNCTYCYAERIAAFGGWGPQKLGKQWNEPIFDEKWFNQDVSKFYPGGVMCFSAHDIYPKNQQKCYEFIERILEESDNKVVIVSKGHIGSIKFLCEKLDWYKPRIEFILTITSVNDGVAAYFEPGAPSISNRFDTLDYLSLNLWKTSILIEPFLDKNPLFLINKLLKYNIKKIWLGTMSGRNYKYHSKENLEKILEIIHKNPLDIREYIWLKNGFREKLNLDYIRVI